MKASEVNNSESRSPSSTPTENEKHIAFEWLRAVATGDAVPTLLVPAVKVLGESRLAAIVLYEWHALKSADTSSEMATNESEKKVIAAAKWVYQLSAPSSSVPGTFIVNRDAMEDLGKAIKEQLPTGVERPE